MKVATFNVNGVKGRVPRLPERLDETRPDFACFAGNQEGRLDLPATGLSKPPATE